MKKNPKAKHGTKPVDQTFTEDERGWAGQHGQRPANEEEKNFQSAATDKTKDRSAGRKT